MEQHEYQTLFDIENDYWWFRALRNVLGDSCKRLGIGSEARLLDAGCGTGKTAAFLRQSVTPNVFAFDLSSHARAFWFKRDLGSSCQASINDVPFKDEVFDAVVSVDVLECDEVDERNACRELSRILKRGGFLIVVVPAYEWLKSPEHHRAVHVSHRYSKTHLRRLLDGLPLKIVRLTHLFATVLPVVAVYRGLRHVIDRYQQGSPHSELKPLPRVVNRMLYHAVDWERRWLGLPRDLPFGSSLLLVAQKVR